MAVVLDGKAIAASVREAVTRRNATLCERVGRPAGLAVVRVGDDPASEVYVRGKRKAALEAGIAAREFHLPADTPSAALLDHLHALDADKNVDAVLVQLPLPVGIRPFDAIDAIAPGKDVDGLHPVNAGLLLAGRPGVRPCTPLGCMRLLDETGVALEGRRAVVVGRSALVGKPLALMLLERGMTVTLCHSKTRGLDEIVSQADVVAAAVGRPDTIRGAWVKQGAVVLDVGTTRGADGKLRGDVEASARERAGYLTPVPGGVGPMTIAMLLWNTMELAERHAAG